jgi:cytochrome c556
MLAAGAPKSTGVAASDEAAIAEHKKKLSAAMKQITANCKDCHVKYRD